MTRVVTDGDLARILIMTIINLKEEKKMRPEISFPVSPRVQTSTPTKYKKQIRLLKQKLRIREATIRNMKRLLGDLKN